MRVSFSHISGVCVPSNDVFGVALVMCKRVREQKKNSVTLTLDSDTDILDRVLVVSRSYTDVQI